MKRKPEIKTLSDLILKADRITKAVNLVTIYRIVAAPLLLILLFGDNEIVFRWLLLVSFLTDIIDGYLARKYKVGSVLGSKLDSVGDDLTILVAITGLFRLRFDFITEELLIVTVLLFLFLFQLIISLIRYRKLSSFHTYAAKFAALLQGSFMLSLFFFSKPVYFLFYFAAIITAAELIEEIVLVFLLPRWKKDVKGLYWVLRKKPS